MGEVARLVPSVLNCDETFEQEQDSRLREREEENLGNGPRRHRWLRTSRAQSVPPGPVLIVDRQWFGVAVGAIIFLNSLAMGMEVQFSGSGHWNTAFTICEHFFTAAFLGEMLVKLKCLGWRGYFSSLWSCGDCFLVIISVLDAWILEGLGISRAGSLSALRSLRLFRVARIFKVVKLMPELTLIMEGLVASLRAMFWLGVLLLVVVYTVAIVCCKVIGASDAYPVEVFDNTMYFGDMFSAMLTLLNLALLKEWAIIVRPISTYQPYLTVFLFAYVGCIAFGLMNSIIGVIVQRTSQSSKKSQDDQEVMRRTQTLAYLHEIGALLSAAPRHERRELAESEELANILLQCKLPMSLSVPDFIQLLDIDDDHDFTAEEFVSGAKRITCCSTFERHVQTMLAVGETKHMVREIQNTLRSLKIGACTEPKSCELSDFSAAFVRPPPASTGPENDPLASNVTIGEDLKREIVTAAVGELKTYLVRELAAVLTAADQASAGTSGSLACHSNGCGDEATGRRSKLEDPPWEPLKKSSIIISGGGGLPVEPSVDCSSTGFHMPKMKEQRPQQEPQEEPPQQEEQQQQQEQQQQSQQTLQRKKIHCQDGMDQSKKKKKEDQQQQQERRDQHVRQQDSELPFPEPPRIVDNSRRMGEGTCSMADWLSCRSGCKAIDKHETPRGDGLSPCTLGAARYRNVDSIA
eukprot:TRINITY_DN1482_c0_g1_i2.p1 TRINITY_DN1482_c0_g1~~TRINITY_DN1482_c0_g1_i2.p1  ORF type:complete len:693 (+),score=146.57 TRINITY_DN1482_c0_g1_i2:106-2184(+)